MEGFRPVLSHPADPDRLELLRMVSKGVNRYNYIRRRVSWSERSIQRWFADLRAQDLVVVDRVGGSCNREHIYRVTDRGRAVLTQGVLPGR